MHSSRPNCFLVSSFEPGLELSPTLVPSAPNHLLHRHTLWGISHYLKGQIISNRGPGELSALVVQDFQAAGLSTSKDFAEVPQVLCQTFRPVYKLISPCIQILAEAGDPWAGKQASRQARDVSILLPKPVFLQQLGPCRQKPWRNHCSR